MKVNAAQQWAAMRSLRENFGASFELLADASGRAMATIQMRARNEGWGFREYAERARDWDERVSHIVEQMMTKIEAIGADPDGGFDKAQIESIGVMLRTLEKVGGFGRGSARENQMRQDAELAGALERIDKRIIELARGYAAWLVGKEPDAKGGRPDH